MQTIIKKLLLMLKLTCLQGVLGIKVKIMLDWDPKGKQGPTMPLPDLVTIHEPKEEDEFLRPLAAEIPVA
jgi:small subunit ribosomal protein S3e